MAILTDDCDINDAKMYMLHGGNGDYYICMKQTKDNKAKFFSQYWEQENLIELEEKYKVWFTCDNDLSESYLELKTISSINNYDLSTLAEQFDISIGSGFLDEYDNLQDFKNNLDINGCWPIGFFDYLRSKGYALPWMGLSVETMVEYGWIKLIFLNPFTCRASFKHSVVGSICE